MNDKELLEMAATAAGIVIDKSKTNGGGANNTGFDMFGNAVLDWHNGILWNPLTDDGDALRLAVKLGLFVDTYSPATTVGNVICPTSLACKTRVEDHDGDPYGATRRAIVRAAAAIGEAMP